MTPVIPTDWEPNPSFVSNIADPVLQSWALAVHGKWKNLVRTFTHSDSCGPECYSSIQVPHPFVVAGGRFGEYYYWDSMWIVDGLLVSGMTNTTKVPKMLSVVISFRKAHNSLSLSLSPPRTLSQTFCI